jgi:hypothetical protein
LIALLPHHQLLNIWLLLEAVAGVLTMVEAAGLVDIEHRRRFQSRKELVTQ